MQENGNNVKLATIIEEFKLETLYIGEKEINVNTSDVNRPGLPLTGFTELYQPNRLQIIGREEHSFLDMLDSEIRDHNIDIFMKISYYVIEKRN